MSPIKDNLNRTYLYADNIAINGGQQQPVFFHMGEEIHLADAEGSELLVRIIELLGSSALIEYRAIPKSNLSILVN